jgi:hypothetical protein
LQLPLCVIGKVCITTTGNVKVVRWGEPPNKNQKLRVNVDVHLKTDAAAYSEDRHLKRLCHLAFPNATNTKDSDALPCAGITQSYNRATEHNLTSSLGLFGGQFYARARKGGTR